MACLASAFVLFFSYPSVLDIPTVAFSALEISFLCLIYFIIHLFFDWRTFLISSVLGWIYCPALLFFSLRTIWRLPLPFCPWTKCSGLFLLFGPSF
ncbi:hypothetical protein BDV29DRAFT_165998 [Aspergillus leporis]|uniref:Uncharacterized protein n=1 Tax=Aspergillus leporis TaxID=41062 RepID=A0A5N5XEZ2_9EURO|nr:hypothetical protein BDV29DRAFT_165998 [Aspergillus leporis]